MFFFASVYSQVSLGYDANTAGLYLLVFFGGFAPAAQIGGRILDQRGAKPAIVMGSAIGAAGFGLWAWKLTDLSLGAQWWAIVLAGAGIGLLLGPASTDATNRSINASYGEVTGITQTVRNYGSALGLAVLGTVLGNVFADRFATSFAGFGLPAEQATALAAAAASGSGGATEGSSQLSGLPAQLQEQIGAAVANDFAVATQAVLIGMAIALAGSLLGCRWPTPAVGSPRRRWRSTALRCHRRVRPPPRPESAGRRRARAGVSPRHHSQVWIRTVVPAAPERTCTRSHRSLARRRARPRESSCPLGRRPTSGSCRCAAS